MDLDRAVVLLLVWTLEFMAAGQTRETATRRMSTNEETDRFMATSTFSGAGQALKSRA